MSNSKFDLPDLQYKIDASRKLLEFETIKSISKKLDEELNHFKKTYEDGDLIRIQLLIYKNLDSIVNVFWDYRYKDYIETIAHYHFIESEITLPVKLLIDKKYIDAMFIAKTLVKEIVYKILPSDIFELIEDLKSLNKFGVIDKLMLRQIKLDYIPDVNP